MSNVDQKGVARFSFLALSHKFQNYIIKQGQNILEHDEFNSILKNGFLLNFYLYGKKGKTFIRHTETIFHKKLITHIDDQLLCEYFNRPRRHIINTNILTMMKKHELAHRIGSIPLREDFQKFVIITPKEKGLPIYLAYNCIYPKILDIDFSLFEHFLEAEIVEEYVSHMLRGLVESSLQVNKKSFSDPMHALESVLNQQHNNVPDIHHVLWIFDDEPDMRALMTAISTIEGFDQDFLADESPLWNPVWRCFAEQQEIFIPNINNDIELKLKKNTDFVKHCNLHKQKSILLIPLIVNASVIGVVGFFSRSYGNVLKTYDGFLHFVSEIIIRHVAEYSKLIKFINLDQKLKELTPLMAIGTEVNERMHDIRDDINQIYNIFLKVENYNKYPDRKKIAKIGKTGANIVEKIKYKLSKQLQIYKVAREKTRRTGIMKFFQEIIDKLKVNANINDIDIDLKFMINNEIFVSIQRFYFSRLLENLISNGCYFAKQRVDVRKPWVLIKVYKELSFAILEVSDSGPGISQNPIDKIFEAGETTKSDGYGVGLTIVNRIIEEHKGVIEVFNDEKFGAVFKIKLPLLE